ncbi:hypothetical protein [Pedobacter jeongneungensis]|uniref:hypothetical protein n=1 Tax=Pedobacter jeongneungensis TaxID=947309 RepID=UPI0031DF5975
MNRRKFIATDSLAGVAMALNPFSGLSKGIKPYKDDQTIPNFGLVMHAQPSLSPYNLRPVESQYRAPLEEQCFKKFINTAFFLLKQKCCLLIKNY